MFPGKTISLNEIYTDEAIPEKKHTLSTDDPWWPFSSKFDWALADWFARSKCSKRSIEEYFKEPEFIRKDGIGMKCYNDLMQAIYTIPYGIPQGDQWLERSIIIPSQIYGEASQQYTVIYRPIQQCLEFLLGYSPFESELNWAPIQKYYGDSRVYDEMHTGTWWWEKQASLPPGATIVPVILASDKTLMTKLRGDQSVWPVYMTIGNLSRKVRRRGPRCTR